MSKNARPKGQAFDWEGFWQRASLTPANALAREDLESALAFWTALPYFLGTRDAVAVQDGLACFSLLCAVAEARGLDSAPLSRAAPIFMRLAAGPFGRRFTCKPGRPSFWPSLPLAVTAFVGKPKPSAEDRRTCQAAEDVVSRLMARPAGTKARTPAELLDLVREQRRRTDGLYAEHAHLPPGTRRVICGEAPALTCDVAYRAALEAADADPATYRTLPPPRGAEPLADLNNLEQWVRAIMRKTSARTETPEPNKSPKSIAPWIAEAMEIAAKAIRAAKGGAVKTHKLISLLPPREAGGRMTEHTFRKSVGPVLLDMGFASRSGGAGGYYDPHQQP